ncbi:DUF697 domain-containing protein [Desulfonatronum thiodismutans]|uniref:DUF697 domain-containing protein n=1 Tax=Desulfonatronum thiodismutans TaxID=159290 RepID=UPI0004ABD8DE|nr:DUF697 domain-containing protein [Desulfonatronum thiodismutans]
MRIEKIRERLWEAIFRPRLDEQVLNEAMGKARSAQPPPVVWLLGRTQAGKTSIIRSLTGSPDAVIGNGFQSCTKASRFYDHPESAPVVRFLDTQGLGEVSYDPSEDISFCEAQAHLVIAVIKAAEGMQTDVFDVLRTVRLRHPEWPVIVAQTCLHELYAHGAGHVLPYPFNDPGWERGLPSDLVRALLFQRQELGSLPGTAPVIWVPVDLTLPEDGLNPHVYGLDALWAAVETASEAGLKTRLLGSQDVRDVFALSAHQQIVGYTGASAALGALPVVDMALVPAIQAKMLHSLARIYDLAWDTRRASEFIGLLGTGFMAGYGLRLVGRSLVKLVPVAGQTAGAAYGAVASAGITFALGKAAVFYLDKTVKRQPVRAEDLRKVFQEALESGKQMASSLFKTRQA